MSIHFQEFFRRILLLCCLVVFAVFKIACVSKKVDNSPTAIVYPPSSSIRERATALEKAVPASKAGDAHSVKSLSAPANAFSNVDARSLAALGLDAARKGTLAEAESYFEEANRLGTLGERELLARAYVLYEMGNLQRAYDAVLALWDLLERKRVHSFDEELQASPMKECALLLGMIQLETHERKDGIEMLERLIRMNPRWHAPYLTLGNHYFNSGAFELAERVANTALDRMDASAPPELYFLLARSQKSQAKTDKARRTLRVAQTAFPEDPRLLVFAGLFLYEEGERVEACDLFSKAYEKDPNVPSTSENFAICLIAQGNGEQAKKILKQALLEFPRAYRHHYLLGYAAKKNGEFIEARSAWENYLALAPRNEENRAAIEESLYELPVNSEDKLKVAPIAP